jgi:small ligand-binding sensory domain FIST
MQDRDGQYKITQLSYVLSDYVINRFNSWQEAEIELSKELKSVSVNNNLGTSQNSLTGEIQTVENPLIQNATVANNVASWVKDILKNRKTVTGEYRSDPRLDALDYISLSNKYTSNSTVLITSIKYTYNGAFRGRYEGRIIS